MLGLLRVMCGQEMRSRKNMKQSYSWERQQVKYEKWAVSYQSPIADSGRYKPSLNKWCWKQLCNLIQSLFTQRKNFERRGYLTDFLNMFYFLKFTFLLFSLKNAQANHVYNNTHLVRMLRVVCLNFSYLKETR